MAYKTPNGTSFFYGKNGELLARDKSGNVDEIVTMGNYCVPDEEREAQKQRQHARKRRKKKQKATSESDTQKTATSKHMT